MAVLDKFAKSEEGKKADRIINLAFRTYGVDSHRIWIGTIDNGYRSVHLYPRDGYPILVCTNDDHSYDGEEILYRLLEDDPTLNGKEILRQFWESFDEVISEVAKSKRR